jgi:Na+/H+ antiporter NhaC
MAIAALVLGIVSLVIGVFIPSIGWLGALLAIAGIILGASARKKQDEQYKIATAGMVCSIIGVVINLIFYIACIACVGAIAAAAPLAY